MSDPTEIYDVAIAGAGVSGTSLLYALARYTNLKKLLLVEKYDEVAMVNSHRTSNSQTLHFGDIETNYTLETAKQVNRAASLVKNYLLRYDREQKIYRQYSKMVLAVGTEQIETLERRYAEFKSLFPELRLIGRKEIGMLEPNVLVGRDETEEIVALYSRDGYAVDFQKLSQSLLERALDCTDKQIDVRLGTAVKKIERAGELYRLESDSASIFAKTVAVAAGAHSLLFAKSLGYGTDYALLCAAGSFYSAPKMLRGKVYAVQLKKLPFAAIHGDPEVDDPDTTRFGPTAKVIPLLERRNYQTFWEYIRTAGLSFDAIASFLKILADPFFCTYILRNFLYDVPGIGKRLFLREVRRIVPSLQARDLSYARGYGGLRPQIVNLKTRSLELGQAKIVGDKILFNITPSPGASTCLQNAADDAEQLITFLGQDYRFDREAFCDDLAAISR